MNNHVINWFEIPVKDMARAKQFYAHVLLAQFEDENIDGIRMAMFLSGEDSISGSLVEAEGYEPSPNGAVVYLNGGQDLAEPLQRAVDLGAQVIVPKMAIQDGSQGYFAQFMDSEGNRIGLYSGPVTE